MLRFLTLLLCTLPLALIAAAFAGYGIAKRALQPLDLMAARAQLITATNLSDRLPVPPEDDELGHMASVLNALFARLERAFAEMKRFTADAAHELRTPLANQRLSGELAMRERPGEAGYREAIGEMLEETMRLGQTIDSLLVLAKVEAQQTGNNLVSFELSELIVEVCQLFDVLVEDKHIVIAQRSSVEDASFMRGYRDFLRLALINVVHNAIKFSPAGGQIEISVSPMNIGPLDGRRVCVKDAGPGIPEEDQETVFERFYTGRKPETKQNTGVGLGLSIARLAVERCGGKIYFRPNEHSGTLCCIELPVGSE